MTNVLFFLALGLGLCYCFAPPERKANVRKTLKRWWKNTCDFMEDILEN